MTRSNIAYTDSLARSTRPFETLDSQYKARGLELKAQFQAGKISQREYLAGLAVLVGEYKAEKAGK